MMKTDEDDSDITRKDKRDERRRIKGEGKEKKTEENTKVDK